MDKEEKEDKDTKEEEFTAQAKNANRSLAKFLTHAREQEAAYRRGNNCLDSQEQGNHFSGSR